MLKKKFNLNLKIRFSHYSFKSLSFSYIPCFYQTRIHIVHNFLALELNIDQLTAIFLLNLRTLFSSNFIQLNFLDILFCSSTCTLSSVKMFVLFYFFFKSGVFVHYDKCLNLSYFSKNLNFSLFLQNSIHSYSLLVHNMNTVQGLYTMIPSCTAYMLFNSKVCTAKYMYVVNMYNCLFCL